MKLSLWQQFSSNHSADFTVVGVFESSEAADRAAGTVRMVLKTIAEWYERPENAETRAQAVLPSPSSLSPPEITFSQQFGIDWGGRGLDWVMNSERSVEAVETYQHTVIVNNTRNTRCGPSPFDRLLERLGGKVSVWDDVWPKVRINCLAPDIETAEAITKIHTNYTQAYKVYRESDTGERPEPPVWGRTDEHDFVNHDERQLQLRLKMADIASDLPRVIDYLLQHGCTDFEYWFVED